MEPVESVHMDICQSHNYRKDLRTPRFDNEPRVQEKEMKDYLSKSTIQPSMEYGATSSYLELDKLQKQICRQFWQ